MQFCNSSLCLWFRHVASHIFRGGKRFFESGGKDTNLGAAAYVLENNDIVGTRVLAYYSLSDR